MCSRVYKTVKCLSIRPSVCPIICLLHAAAAGLLLSTVLAGDIYRQRQLRVTQPATAVPQHGAQQQSAFSNKCEQCHIDS